MSALTNLPSALNQDQSSSLLPAFDAQLLPDTSWLMPQLVEITHQAALPHLALNWHLECVTSHAVDIREKIKRSFITHRNKGTLTGIKEAIECHGASLVQAILPPAKTYASSPFTKLERRNWDAMHAEMRLIAQQTLGQASGWMLRPYCGATYMLTTDADKRTTPIVIKKTGSVAKQLFIHQAQAQRIYEPSHRGVTAFVHGILPNMLITSTAKDRVYTLGDANQFEEVSSRNYGGLLLHPSIHPVNHDITQFFEKTTTAKRGSLFIGQPIAISFMPKSSRKESYRRIQLLNSSLYANGLRQNRHLGAGRLGMPSHTAELLVAFPVKRYIRAADQFLTGYLIATPTESFNQLTRSIKQACPASNHVFLNTHLYQPILSGTQHIASANLIAGSIKQR
jgi:hypothetical protein